MISEIEIDESYKEIMAQKSRNISATGILQRIDWINEIEANIRQIEIKKLAAILIIEIQRFREWENVRKDYTFGNKLLEVISMIAATEYRDGEQGMLIQNVFVSFTV